MEIKWIYFKMRIFLVGYMGCGKSSLGRKLSDRLGISFIDLDLFIETRYQKTISEIFKKFGEKGFREKERICLREVCSFENVIIAVGGGAPCFYDNMEKMKDNGSCFFLDVGEEEIVSRLMKSKQERPLIEGKSSEEIMSFVKKMMKQRRPYYEKAQYVIKGNDIKLEELFLKVKESVNDDM